jgi:hypothetical protein
MALTKITSTLITDDAITTAKINADAVDETKIADNAVTTDKINANAVDETKIADDVVNSEHLVDGGVDDAHLATGIDATKLTGSIANARIPAGAVTQHVTVPKLDSPVITGTLSVLDEGTVTHTIANYSADCSYTITPTNCTAGAVNGSGEFVITHTSGTPSYTIKATTVSLGLDDSALTTKNITMQLSAPTLSHPPDGPTATNVVYTITSTTANDDKIILDPGTANFTYQSVSVGTASKVGNTVECIGFTTNNPAVTIQFTAEATYNPTAKSVNIAGTYGTSPDSAADAIQIVNGPSSSGVGASNFTWGAYTIHKFISSGTFNTGNKTSFDILVVAGGGAGGDGVKCGGGGAGGVIYTAGQSLTGGTDYTITVGAGGTESGSSYTTAGNSSVASVIVATGGGHGGDSDEGPSNGGSGGGAAVRGPNGEYTTGAGTGISGQGNNGADWGQNWGGAGGGGKGSAGSTNNGGSGTDYSSYFGTSNIPGSGVVGAGGGGGAGNGKYSGTGGSGIGGNGNSWEHATQQSPRPPVANTGSGAGGGADIHGNASDINGADGLVLIRYTT